MWIYVEALARFGVLAQVVGKRVVKSNGLEGTSKVTSILIGINILPRSPNQTNDLRMIDIYIMNKMKSPSPFSLSSLLILFLCDIACSSMPNKVIGFPLLLSSIFQYFHVDFSSELQETTSVSDVIKESTIKWSIIGGMTMKEGGARKFRKEAINKLQKRQRRLRMTISELQ
ncbi:hypothetical protein M9H77_21826 [Catharanthus roseus]|uniref:Uncharacterized protein n=1 Tax=Catharanthus roseus TaxID=4058 RepID=A0ACC0ANF6_CATRO|nr:hypothetical protein M9H77_21826 [Catharanthus roseus]